MLVSGPSSFYGFAESRQADLNVPMDVTIDSVFVRPGQFVKQGTVLLQVVHAESELKTKQAGIQKELLAVKKRWTKQEITSRINALNAELEVKLAPLKAKMQVAESDAAFFQNLIPGNSGGINPEVTALKNEIAEIQSGTARQIENMRSFLMLPDQTGPSIQLLQEEEAFLFKSRQALVVRAPFDGIVGTMAVYPGEHVAAFSSLVTMVATAPTIVTAYIHERYNIAMATGNGVEVESAYLAKGIVQGKIVNKGNRIVEIPEKFAKVPGVKQYGVEVFIELPENNPFLQKEVLTIRVVK
jgi:multidrug resistance efflux pump